MYDVVFEFTDPASAFSFLNEQREAGWTGHIVDTDTGKTVEEPDFASLRGRLMLGERIAVRHRHGTDEGLLYLDGQEIMFTATKGWAEGVTEPLCALDSRYLDVEFLSRWEVLEHNVAS